MGRIADAWGSFRALPAWVRIWVALILVPVNGAAGLIAGDAGGWPIAALAMGGMLLNLPILLAERGFSKAMAFPHLALWTPLVVILALRLAGGGDDIATTAFLSALLAVDLISLAFDATDAAKWLRGDRAVAG